MHAQRATKATRPTVARASRRIDAREISHALLAYLIGLNVSDLITTHAVLRRGGAEANPFMRGVVDDMLHATAVKCVALAILVMLVLRTHVPARAAWTLGVVAVWYAVVVGWNLSLLSTI